MCGGAEGRVTETKGAYAGETQRTPLCRADDNSPRGQRLWSGQRSASSRSSCTHRFSGLQSNSGSAMGQAQNAGHPKSHKSRAKSAASESVSPIPCIVAAARARATRASVCEPAVAVA